MRSYCVGASRAGGVYQSGELRVESGADEPLARRFINSSLYFDIDPSVKTCGFATSLVRGRL